MSVDFTFVVYLNFLTFKVKRNCFALISFWRNRFLQQENLMQIPSTKQCICCDGTSHAVVYENLTSIYNFANKKYAIEACSTCGNIRTLPKPTADELSEIYSSVYLYDVHKLIISEKRYRAKGLVKIIKNKFQSRIRVLEVGCNYGYLLEQLNNAYEVSGIELDKSAVQYCVNKNLNVIQDSIEHFAALSTETFDLIILSHVFEHLLNPDETLVQLQKLLKENGQLLILVPNSNSISRKLFGRFWGWWQVPVHINHFNPDSLSALFKKHDYEKQNVYMRGGDSLMLLLSVMNIFKANKPGSKLSVFKSILIRMISSVLRFWYAISNEELGFLAKRK